MCKLLLSLLTVIAILSSVYSQGSPNSRASITDDYNQVRIVARIKVLTTERVEKIGGYSIFRITGQIVEPYKGKVEPGGSFTYYMQVEDGIDMNRYRGEKIVFVQIRHADERSDYRSLENSDREPTQKVISILRSLKRSTKHNKTTKT
jgi:hypothetical protein